ncbi:uncharacterized protein LOC124489778 [Dermatophagoides farinae]|uniref:uncharacterized protein LOC124489778 n=1 Tax=Dermatophagoides farinae TaxID=6954 RepID=UPI003F607BCA
MFVIHYICTQYSKHIHMNGTKSLMYLNTITTNDNLIDDCNRNLNLHFHWKLCLHIEKFHTKKQYGFTYGRFGIISMAGFVRFLMIYCKMAMVTYKMINF